MNNLGRNHDPPLEDNSIASRRNNEVYSRNSTYNNYRRARSWNRDSSQSSSRYPPKRIYPITSYGLIVFHRNPETNELKFLVYQRRDNYEYIEFLRGHFKTHIEATSLLALMSQDERERILNHSFAELWRDLWINNTCRIFRDGYARAEQRFEEIKPFLEGMVHSTRALLPRNPFGFPKGKLNALEDHVECAKREFEEETRIPASTLRVLIEVPPLVESYTGSNGKLYSTYYYLAEATEMQVPELIEAPDCCIRKLMLSSEAQCVVWITLQEAPEYLNPRRTRMLYDVERILNS